MGQKVNPHGLRVGVIKDWDSRWYVKDEQFGDTIVADHKLRLFLKEQLKKAGVPKIEIERDSARLRVIIHCAKPGIVIGRQGSEIEKLKANIEKFTGMPCSVSVVEVKQPELNAQLVSENIAEQLENRISFRRAMKQAIKNAIRLNAKGIKVKCSGRLGGAEIARNEHYHEGTIPLQTLRADIEYGVARANTTYGVIGVKVWIYNGEVLKGEIRENKPARTERNERGDRRRNDRANGAGRNGDRRPPRKPRTEAKKVEGGNE